MLVTITDFIDNLTNYFEKAFEDYEGLSYKCSNDPNSGDNTAHPDIFQYLMPSSMLIDGYPSKSPCIVLCVDSLEQNTYSCSVHSCVRYDAISEQEKVHKVAGADNLYEYLDTDGYNTVSDVELYKSSLLFTTHIHKLLCNYTNVSLDDISVELPDPSLPDFPYSISCVNFKVKLNHTNIGMDPYTSLY